VNIKFAGRDKRSNVSRTAVVTAVLEEEVTSHNKSVKCVLNMGVWGPPVFATAQPANGSSLRSAENGASDETGAVAVEIGAGGVRDSVARAAE
jgi:hypothetical protein